MHRFVLVYIQCKTMTSSGEKISHRAPLYMKHLSEVRSISKGSISAIPHLTFLSITLERMSASLNLTFLTATQINTSCVANDKMRCVNEFHSSCAHSVRVTNEEMRFSEGINLFHMFVNAPHHTH